MSLDMAGNECIIGTYKDEDGVHLICKTVVEESCPLRHPGELGPDCIRGEPAMPDSHVVVTEGNISVECANAYHGSMPEDRDLQECSTCTDRTRRCFAPKVKKKRRLKRYGGMVRMPDEEKKEEEQEETIEPEESPFEETPVTGYATDGEGRVTPTVAPELTPTVVEPEMDIVTPDDDDEAPWFEQVIEEFETMNDYTFGLVVAKDDEGEPIVTLTLDNVNIDIRLADCIDMVKALKAALPRLKEIYMED